MLPLDTHQAFILLTFLNFFENLVVKHFARLNDGSANTAILSLR